MNLQSACSQKAPCDQILGRESAPGFRSAQLQESVKPSLNMGRISRLEAGQSSLQRWHEFRVQNLGHITGEFGMHFVHRI